MKRSDKIFIGAIGACGIAWGIETAMKPKRPACPIGADGKAVITADCDPASSSSSRSGGSSGGGWGSSSSSGNANAGHGTPAPHVVSKGGWGSFARGFSGGG